MSSSTDKKKKRKGKGKKVVDANGWQTFGDRDEVEEAGVAQDEDGDHSVQSGQNLQPFFSTPGAAKAADGGLGDGDSSASVSEEGFDLNIDDMSFSDLKNLCESFVCDKGSLHGVFKLSDIRSCYVESPKGLLLMKSLCTIGHSFELGKIKNTDGSPFTLSDMKILFRPLPESHKADSTTTLTSDQNMDIGNTKVKLLSEKVILGFFIDENGKNILSNPSHWTVQHQRCFEKLMVELFPKGAFPTRVLVWGNLSMAATYASCSPWDGETAASAAVVDAGEDFGFAFPLVLPEHQGSECAMPSNGDALLYSTLTSREKRFTNMVLKNPLPSQLFDAIQAMHTMMTKSLASRKTQLTSSYLTVANKWDNAQKAMFETVKVIMTFLAKSSNPQLASAARIELTNSFSPQGTIHRSNFYYSFPDIARRYVAATFGIRGNEGSAAFKCLQNVVNEAGSNLGGVNEVVAMLSHPFTKDRGLVDFLIECRDLATTAQEVAKPLPGSDVVNPCCSSAVALWSAINRVHAASKSNNFNMLLEEKKFVKELVEKYHRGEIPDFNRAISFAQKAMLNGLLLGTRRSHQIVSDPVAYVASGGDGNSGGGRGHGFGSGHASGGNKRGGMNEPISIDEYKKAMGTFLDQLKNAPPEDCHLMKYLVPIDCPKLGEFNYRLRPAQNKDFSFVYVPKSVTGNFTWAVVLLRKAADRTSPTCNKLIADAPSSAAMLGEARESARLEKKKRKTRAARERKLALIGGSAGVEEVDDQASSNKSRSPSPISGKCADSKNAKSKAGRERAADAEHHV
jgi:hypothetical protein